MRWRSQPSGYDLCLTELNGWLVPQLGILFWNTAGNATESRVARMLGQVATDVVILVEPGTTVDAMRVALSSRGPFRLVSDPLSPIHVYSRLRGAGYVTWLNDARWQILTAEQPGTPQLLLVAAHLPSKTNANDFDQLNAALELSDDIRRAEEAVGHARTILVGDLNMNPFEPGVAMNRALNATSTRQVAAWETRTVQRREYPLFYNPMWGLFGDRTPGPPGSYYRAASHAVNYACNVYDQVLVRPSVMHALDEVKLLDSDGEESLLTRNGLPDSERGSDHLPWYFRLDLDKIEG